MSQSLKLLQILDFASIQIKNFKSNSLRVENTLNKSKLLQANQRKTVHPRPDYNVLITEILKKPARNRDTHLNSTDNNRSTYSASKTMVKLKIEQRTPEAITQALPSPRDNDRSNGKELCRFGQLRTVLFYTLAQDVRVNFARCE